MVGIYAKHQAIDDDKRWWPWRYSYIYVAMSYSVTRPHACTFFLNCVLKNKTYVSLMPAIFQALPVRINAAVTDIDKNMLFKTWIELGYTWVCAERLGCCHRNPQSLRSVVVMLSLMDRYLSSIGIDTRKFWKTIFLLFYFVE